MTQYSRLIKYETDAVEYPRLLADRRKMVDDLKREVAGRPTGRMALANSGTINQSFYIGDIRIMEAYTSTCDEPERIILAQRADILAA